MSTYYRAQILLEPEQHRTLSELAEREGRSISDLVRESVRMYLVERDRESKREREQRAIDTLAEIRASIQARHGVFDVDLIAEARDERDRDNERVWRGEP
jgi:metal-responsive CopG/Arc/MetJ family transcriptional regulator